MKECQKQKSALFVREKGFSLIEILVGLLIITVVMATCAPTLSKRAATKKAIADEKITNNCDAIDPTEKDCALCRVDTQDTQWNILHPSFNHKKCMICKKACTRDQELDVSACTCIDIGTYHDGKDDIFTDDSY